jgi:hypothetical protein
MEKWPVWLRWTLMLPAALVASLVIQIVIAIVSSLSHDVSVLSWFPDWVIQLINSVAGGFAFVWAAGWMAPRGKTVVAIIFTVLITLLVGMVAMASLLIPTSVPLRLGLAGDVLIIGGAVWACISIYQEQRTQIGARSYD